MRGGSPALRSLVLGHRYWSAGLLPRNGDHPKFISPFLFDCFASLRFNCVPVQLRDF